MYDVIIIGAGPAGLMAARCLKKHNVNFLVLEKKKEIGKPLRCGEGISCREFHELFDHGKYDFITNKVEEHEIVYGNLVRTFCAPFYQLDRPKFEKWLSEPVKECIKTDVGVLDVDVRADCVEVITYGDNKGSCSEVRNNYRAKLIILCSGCNYSIQRKYGMVKKNPVVVPCYGAICENYSKDKNKFSFLFDKYPGYMWVFPKDESRANIGIGVFNKKVDIKALFEETLAKNNINVDKLIEFSGVFPASGPIDKTYSNRILACGNAAGFVYAGTGEGIYFALRSGMIASQVCVEALIKNKFDETALKVYEERWKKVFGDLLEAGLIFLDILEIGYSINQVRKMFENPSEQELKEMVLEGKIPKRAKLFWKLSKKFNLKNKKEIPMAFKVSYNIIKKLSS